MRPGSRTFLLGAAVTVAMILVLASCVNPLGTADYEDRLAVVDSVSAPDSQFYLQPIAVTIFTEAPNECWRQGRDDAEPATGGVVITPYDEAYTGKSACDEAVAHFRHQISLRASAKGTFTISVKTRLKSVSGADSVGTVTRTVVAN